MRAQAGRTLRPRTPGRDTSPTIPTPRRTATPPAPKEGPPCKDNGWAVAHQEMESDIFFNGLALRISPRSGPDKYTLEHETRKKEDACDHSGTVAFKKEKTTAPNFVGIPALFQKNILMFVASLRHAIVHLDFFAVGLWVG